MLMPVTPAGNRAFNRDPPGNPATRQPLPCRAHGGDALRSPALAPKTFAGWPDPQKGARSAQKGGRGAQTGRSAATSCHRPVANRICLLALCSLPTGPIVSGHWQWDNYSAPGPRFLVGGFLVCEHLLLEHEQFLVVLCSRHHPQGLAYHA
jgi:hypothetical protein